MFKRVLVLVLFLFGVFWWLTHRGGDEVAEPTTEVAAEETAATEEATEGEAGESEASTEATETTEESSTTESATAEPTPVTTTTVAATTTAAPTTPVVKPVIVTPSVPARTTDVKVYVYEWNVDMSDKTIPAGTVNFAVQNDGRFTHDFSLSSFGNLGKVMPGETKTFTVKLRAGEYEAFSKRRQDYERGVTETFTVTP